ncbi:hypothetical protein [Nodularia chucula]|uniref:hypothetical protein n=1 Tax=Nodularia chucula TaxID=3093667 RepID=UPI0039C74D97
MEIIYIILLLLTLLLAGVNLNIFLYLSYDLGDVMRGKLKLIFFIKKVALGLFICILCSFMAVILTGEHGFLLTVTSFPILSPLCLILGLIFNFIGQRPNVDSILDSIIQGAINFKRRNRL